MVATFGWIEYLTNATNTATPTNVNFGNTVAANIAPSTYPVTAGTFSYDKYIRAYFSGSFTRIENLQFWMSGTGPYVTGETIAWTGQQTQYATPTGGSASAQSVHATTAVPTADPGTANVSVGGSLSGSLTSAGYSDYIILQASVTTAASAGAVNQKTFTLQYDEV